MKTKAKLALGGVLFLIGILLLVAFAFVDTTNGMLVLGQLIAAIVLLALGLWLMGKARGHSLSDM